ncbi:hypothetical protein ACP70R_043528 [Stipagrostis hirtigluma subsp. patula]
MDRRLRSPARGRHAAPRADERLCGGSPHRFLRPGALARLRDSRIIARSLRSAARAPCFPPPSSPRPASPAVVAAAADGGGVPHFVVAARGPMRYPLRKRLAAARSVAFLPPTQQADAAEAFLGAFAPAPSDLVAAR